MLKNHITIIVVSVVILQLIFCLNAYAEDVSVQMTNTTTAQIRTDVWNSKKLIQTPNEKAEKNYGIIIDRLDISANSGPFTASVRIDGVGLFYAPNDSFQSFLSLERTRLSYEKNGLTLDVGDFYQQLGRGLTLSMRKTQQTAVDISIFGARAKYQMDHHQFMLFGGKSNSINIDSINQKYVADTQDLFAGGNYEFQLNPRFKNGMYFLYSQLEERLLAENLDFNLNAGAYFDLPNWLPWLSTYLEAIVQERFVAGSGQHGAALYFQNQLQISDFTFFLENMYLYDFEQIGSRNSALQNRFVYNQPPTLERIDQTVLNNRSALGSRARLEYFQQDLNLLLFSNLMLKLTDPFETAEVLQVHGFIGTTFYYSQNSSRMTLEAGYRQEQQVSSNIPLVTILHFDVDAVHQLTPTMSLHSNAKLWKRTFNEQDFMTGQLITGLEDSRFGSIGFEFGYDTFIRTPGAQHLFFAVLAEAKVNKHLSIKSTIGSQRGGIKCVSGVCREYPTFNGAQLVLISHF